MNTIFQYALPSNEPIQNYAPQSKERALLMAEVERQKGQVIDIPLIIGGKEIRTKQTAKVRIPHDHQHVLATYSLAGKEEVQMAIDAALKAKKEWLKLDWTARAAILWRVADLIAGKYRYILNAATMLGQSKNVYQAEIDSACEMIDFLRFNNYFASQIYSDQPLSTNNALNLLDYRPLEGFVYSITPFNFTAIAGNLNTAPVLMGNVTVWKPSGASILSNYYLMKIFEEAGIPPGVINFIPGDSVNVSSVVMTHKDLAGIHFTGSTQVFNTLWKTVANNLDHYRSYPKLVGETGGKDFVFAHASANIDSLATALIRGAFEYQGQKCSAASRAYIPQSLWPALKERLIATLAQIKTGSTDTLSNFVNAVINERAYDKIQAYITAAAASADAEIVAGGNCSKTEGYFIEPCIIKANKADYPSMVEEIFGPVLSIYVYPDDQYKETLDLCNNSSPYALTGAVFANCVYAIDLARKKLLYAAGNFYINDKPTGAVVGQQPFGGSRKSGTNDKAGCMHNLLRWVSPRTIKETTVAATHFDYPFMN